MVSSKNASGDETIVLEYEVDDGNQALVEVWNFGHGGGLYGATMGEVHRLPGGNVIHNYGQDARVREGTHGGTVVWDVDWAGYSIGRSTSLTLADLYALQQ